MPRRAVVGWDPNRLSMVLAVLAEIYRLGRQRCARQRRDQGRRHREIGRRLGDATIRPVAQAPARLKEAHKLGFARALMPQGRGEPGERGGLPAESLRRRRLRQRRPRGRRCGAAIPPAARRAPRARRAPGGRRPTSRTSDAISGSNLPEIASRARAALERSRFPR
jgi:hypothetical protein